MRYDWKRVVWVVCSVVMATGVTAATATAEEGDDAVNGEVDIVHHEMNGEETLATVALKYQVNVTDLKEWNELDSIHDANGNGELKVRLDDEPPPPSGPQPVTHIIRSGDTYEDIARQYGVRVSQLRQWNPNTDPRRLQIGQQLRLHVPVGDGHPVSWGRANSGRLYNGVAMECSPGLRVRNVARSYGTQRTINLLQAAGADVQARWPDAPELVVGSLSLRNGGPMRPHRSHQNGRDADLTYYHRGNIELPDFRDMTPETFDAVKNWHFFRTLIDTGEVEFIFVDYELQRVLYEYALSIGVDEEELAELIQYPRGQRTPEGIIRHARGHANHFHIRFECGERDRNCH